MLEYFEKIIYTFQNRWYVVVFFCFYIFVGLTAIGWRKLIVYTFIGYFLALICEASSIRNGFPFGLYHYMPEVIEKELSIFGVPIWDSLSFVFLTFFPYQISIFLYSKMQKSGKYDIAIIENPKVRHSLKVIITAVVLMFTLDFIIDPLTLQGEKWFLGKLYYYPNGGSHFGVPVSNYLGWGFTGLTIIVSFVLTDKYLLKRLRNFNPKLPALPFKAFYSLIMYFGIIFFNLGITFIIGLYEIGVSGLTIVVPLTTILVSSIIFKIEILKK